MKYRLGMQLLVKIVAFTALVLLQGIHLHNCHPVDPLDGIDITQLTDAKSLKTELLIIIKNAEKFILNLDEWAIEKTVNFTKTDQLSSENIKQVENEIIQIQTKINDLNNKLEITSISDIDISQVSAEKLDIEGDIELLDDKFEKYLGINLRILGEFYDNYFGDIISKKEILHSDIKEISLRIDEIKREKELEKLLEECAHAVKQGKYQEFVFNLKLINNYENDTKVINEKIYGIVGFDAMLEFANNIGNVNISSLLYQQIYKEIQNFSDDHLKIRLVLRVRQLIDGVGSETKYTNIINTLKEQWKKFFKRYLYSFINNTDPRTLHDHIELIYEIVQLDEKLLNDAFEELFDEINCAKGEFAAINKKNIREIYMAYFDAIKTIVDHHIMWRQSSSSTIINLAFQAKNKLSLLKGFPLFFSLPNDGRELKNALYPSVTKLVFWDSVCIRNENNKFLKSSNIVTDGYKNLVSTRSNEFTAWKIVQHNFTTYKIISEDGTLFADDDCYSFGRFIFTKPNTNETYSEANLWQFEVYNNGLIYIKSKLYSEYLYDSNDQFIFSSKSRSSGWIVGECE